MFVPLLLQVILVLLDMDIMEPLVNLSVVLYFVVLALLEVVVKVILVP